ncbi:MAG TPA: hypothetical protein VIY27_01450 [Myxococcota bacterium]
MSRTIHRRGRRPGRGRLGLAGQDLARVRIAPRSRRRFLAMLLAAGLLAGFALAALRIDILRTRYALADALAEEQVQIERRSVETARVEALRDPARLAALAAKRGLSRPGRVIDLAPTQLAARSAP